MGVPPDPEIDNQVRSLRKRQVAGSFEAKLWTRLGVGTYLWMVYAEVSMAGASRIVITAGSLVIGLACFWYLAPRHPSFGIFAGGDEINVGRFVLSFIATLRARNVLPDGKGQSAQDGLEATARERSRSGRTLCQSFKGGHVIRPPGGILAWLSRT